MRPTKRQTRMARRLYRFCLVGHALDQSRVRLVMHQAVAASRPGLLGALAHFRTLVRLNLDRHTAQVETAVPLSPQAQQRLAAVIARRFDRRLETTFAVNADLIAGLQVRVGSEVLDGSIRGRLAALEAAL